MAQVLSQDEVDALLNAVNDGEGDDFLGEDGDFGGPVPGVSLVAGPWQGRLNPFRSC